MRGKVENYNQLSYEAWLEYLGWSLVPEVAQLLYLQNRINEEVWLTGQKIRSFR